jgi:ribosomal protein S18 acetylase RimI-like enzyme
MEITFQIATNISYNHVIEKIEGLTFPPIRKKVKSIPIYEPYIGVWALKNKTIIGLILADRNKNNVSELFSFYVIPDERNKGVGTKLLSLLENTLREKGMKSLQTRYRTDWKSLSIIEKILKSNLWYDPITLLHIFNIEIKHFPKFAWPDVKLSRDYSIFNWKELLPSEKDLIKKAQQNKQIPLEFNPFQNETKICMPVSFGLRYKGTIVGWNLAYSLKPDTIELNNLYIFPDFRNIGSGISLLNKSFNEQYKLSIPHTIWITKADNTPILKIVKRIAGQYLDKNIELRIAKKTL